MNQWQTTQEYTTQTENGSVGREITKSFAGLTCYSMIHKGVSPLNTFRYVILV